jgi:hypothetical protein
MNEITAIAIILATVYIMARLIIMAYFAERTAHIKHILKMQKEHVRNNG